MESRHELAEISLTWKTAHEQM